MLLKSEHFKKEYEEYYSKISKIRDPKIKGELETLLTRLVNEVKTIDNTHQELILNPKLPPALIDHRMNLQEIRQQLVSKLKDCERAKLF